MWLKHINGVFNFTSVNGLGLRVYRVQTWGLVSALLLSTNYTQAIHKQNLAVMFSETTFLEYQNQIGAMKLQLQIWAIN